MSRRWPRPTRRGWVALGVVVVSFGLAAGFGARALNAVAAPTLVALLVGTVQVVRAEQPTVTVRPPRAGFPDARRELTVAVEGDGLVDVSLTVPPGLAGRAITATVTPPATLTRTVTLADRGVHDVPPPAVRVRGPLGLVARPIAAPSAGEAVVYPRPYAIGADVDALFGSDPVAERQEFDRLREYVPGDPLRNVHWKSSAKRDEYLVMEFTAGGRDETLTVVAGAETGYADEMAGAAATIVERALAADWSVALAVPDGRVGGGRGERHRAGLLGLLARTGAGPVPDPTAETDAGRTVTVHAGAAGTTLRAGDHEFEFTRRTGRKPDDREVPA